MSRNQADFRSLIKYLNAKKILDFLKEFGTETTGNIVEDFYSGNIIQYQKTINSADITGYIKLEKQRLISSIVSIDSQSPNDGVIILRRFYKKSKELCKIAKVSELELIGIAVINREVELFLQRNGFISGEMLIPDELGNDGKATCYSKIIKV